MEAHYLWMADVVMVVHFAFVLFVVLSVPFIWVAHWCGWPIARGPRFRTAHGLCMLLVLVQALFGVICPLTTLEDYLRYQGALATQVRETFMQRIIHDWLFFDVSMGFMTWVYAAFFALILYTMWHIRPDYSSWRRRSGDSVSPPPQ